MILIANLLSEATILIAKNCKSVLVLTIGTGSILKDIEQQRYAFLSQ